MPNTDTQSESKREGVADTATERVKILGGVPALVNLSERLAASPSEVTSPAPEQSAPPAKPEFPSEDPAQQAKTEGVADNAAESKAPRNFPWRVVKILSATVLLAIGLYAMAVPHLVVTTDNAVVSAYLASVRVPIEGTLSGPALSPGSRIEKGSAIAHIENSRTTDDNAGPLSTIRFNCTWCERAIEEQISALYG